MHKKRALVLGNLPSVFVKDYIANVLIPLGYDVDVKVDFSTKEIRNKSEIVAKELGIHLIEKKEKRITSRIRNIQKKNMLKKWGSFLLGLLYKYYSIVNKLKGSYDVVYVINIYYEILKHALRYKSQKTMMVATWIGSDILRRDDVTLEKTWASLNLFDVVTVLSSRLEKAFYERLLFGREYSFDVKKIYIGQISFEYIDKLRKSNQPRQLQRKTVDDTKLIIGIGYNANEAQQHKLVLRELSKLDDKMKSNIVVILQLSYGDFSGGKYTNEVVALSKDSGFETITYDEFFDYEEVAQIRLATDVYINSQTTDAFAGTIREYLYSDTVLFNASWLEYEEFEEWGIKSITFDSFAELPNMIVKYDKEKGKTIAIENREKIVDKFSWDRCKNEWSKLFENTKVSHV